MPFTLKDVEKHNKGLDDKKKAQWVQVANSVYAKCIKDGGDDKACAPKAIQQANGVVATHSDMKHQSVGAYNYEIREETHQGKKYMVVPVVMMTSDVHSGSHGPLLHLAEDLGKFPASWDGIPISIQHPQENGNIVSANQPHIIDNQVVGKVFNTRMDEGKLRAEAWIDQDAIQRISPEAFKYIQEGKPLDVSVGVFTEDEYSTGDYNGKHYEGIARNHRPDHLALLPGGTGACSWATGCGIRANASEGDKMQTNIGRLKYDGTESTAWSGPTLTDFGMEGRWQDLTDSDRAKVAAHYLIGTSQTGSFSDLKLPVVNPKTGKLNEFALRAVISGRGSAITGVNPKEKMAAQRMAYQLLNDEFGAALAVPTNMEAYDLFNEQTLKALALLGINVSVNQMSFDDISESIQTKIDEMNTATKIYYLKEAFPDYFIYCLRSAQDGLVSIGPRVDEMDGELFKQGYKVAADGITIEFTGVAQPVVKKVEYITQEEQGDSIMANKDEKKPCCAEKVELLIQSEDTQFTEGDREWLMSMDEGQIAKLETNVTPADKAKAQQMMLDAQKMMDEANTLMGNQATTKEQAIQVLKEELGDQTKFLGLLPPETRATMEHGLRLYKAEREKKIGHILANTNADVYSQARLIAMSDQDLDDLARAIKAPASYAPMSSQTLTNNEEILLPAGVVLDG